MITYISLFVVAYYSSRYPPSEVDEGQNMFFVKSPDHWSDECKALRLNSDLTTSIVDVNCNQRIGCLCSYE